MDQREALDLVHAASLALAAGDTLTAEVRCRMVLQARPETHQASHQLGQIYQRLGRLDDALERYDQALSLAPDDVASLNNRGNVLCSLGRLEEALASFNRAVALRPDLAQVVCNRGLVLYDLGRLDESLACFDRAVELQPADAGSHNNRGLILRDMMRLDEALAAFDRAVALQPDYAIALYNRSMLLLLRGEFAAGWSGYEQRWLQPNAPPRLYADYPLWRGDTELAGRTILLHAEQGYGDTIQFARYAGLVRQRGARVLLVVPPELVALMRTLPFDVEILTSGDPLPPIDLQCPLLSLPLAFGTTEATIPGPDVYLHASQQKLAEWQRRLGQTSRKRVGIVWSGSATHQNDRNRSIPPELLGELLSQPAEFICLHKEAPVALSPDLRWFGEDLVDFADTAALVACCDLVISVDTAAAHLAGALGRPLWLLLPYRPDWRWLLARTDSPWYPTARLFRQPALGDWRLVLSAVSAALAGICL